MKRFALASLICMSWGCAASTPQDVVAEYGQAVQRGEPREAYALLAPDLREKLPYEEFARRWSAQRQTLALRAHAFTNAAHDSAQINAVADYNDYDNLEMTLTQDGWRISGGVLSVFDQSSPRSALRSFVRALESRDYEALMRFVPSEYAQHMSPQSLQTDLEARRNEIDDLVIDLKANLDGPIIVDGHNAYLRYGSRQLTLQLEGDAWKIEDPD